MAVVHGQGARAAKKAMIEAMRLAREIRFSLVPETLEGQRPINSWAGWPGTDALAPYLTLRATLTGPIDPSTGYLCNIKDIDALLRERAVPLLQRSYHQGEHLSTAWLARACFDACAAASPPGIEVVELRLAVTPYLNFEIRGNELPMIRMTQSFEFSASHRLFCRELSADDNRRRFGKCANPHGHGHNYIVEVTVAGSPDARTGSIVDLNTMERAVKEAVVERFDHKYLNLDCEEFAEINPTIENITRVIWDKLNGRLAPAQLVNVRVWETPKTYAEYAGAT
jgi:6-pyruvoyltetrahydropterin/6-carboxytetrahydropterin synthase